MSVLLDTGNVYAYYDRSDQCTVVPTRSWSGSTRA
jgi:hypothetical protein